MDSKSYWKKRFEKLETSRYDDAKKLSGKLNREYRKAFAKIQTEIESWYQRYADKEGISLASAKKELNARELDAFKMQIEEYIEKGRTLNYSTAWKDELEAASTAWHVTRLESLQKQMEQAAEEALAAEESGLNKHLADVYEKVYGHTAFEIAKGTGIGTSLAKIDNRRIKIILSEPWAADGKNFSKRIWGDKRPKLINSLKNNLTQSVIRGEDPQKLIRQIQKKFDTAASSAGRLVMTETAFISQAAIKECYKELDIERYEILATLDSRTSELCRDMDGKVFNLEDYEIGNTAPPFHPNCRTTTCPYYDDEFTKDEKRASRDEGGKYQTVPANMTYREWEKGFHNSEIEPI